MDSSRVIAETVAMRQGKIQVYSTQPFIHAVALGLLRASLCYVFYKEDSLHLNSATLLRHSCRLLECRY